MFSEISGVDGMGDGDIAVIIMTLVVFFVRLRSQQCTFGNLLCTVNTFDLLER